MRIAIVGAGRMGRALEHLLKQNHHDIRLFDKDPDKVAGADDLDAIASVADAGCIFFCVPSWAMREAVEGLRLFFPLDALIVSLAKGLERGTRLTMDGLLAEALPAAQPYALLAGPTMAEEIIKNYGAAAVLASSSRDTFDRINALFAGTPMRLEWSDDLRSVAFASVLKNVYALGLGIFSALDRGGNDLGWFFSRMLQEMLVVGQALGASKQIFLGVAGVGDLVCTGMSPHSRNRQVGEAIVKTGTCPQGSEGCASLPSLLSLLDGQRAIAPIAQAVERIAIGHENALEVFRGF